MLLFSCIFVISACFLVILLNESHTHTYTHVYVFKRLIVDVGNGLVMC